MMKINWLKFTDLVVVFILVLRWEFCTYSNNISQ